MSTKYDFNNPRNEYINGNISYQKLSEKYDIPFSILSKTAVKEKWREAREIQRKTIAKKVERKTAEKIANKEVKRIERINNAADKLLEKIELATEQLDMYLSKSKKKYTQAVRDKKTGKLVYVDIEDEDIKSIRTERINKAELKQIASALKDLKDIQFVKDEDKPQDDTSINITVVPATNDVAEDDDE